MWFLRRRIKDCLLASESLFHLQTSIFQASMHVDAGKPCMQATPDLLSLEESLIVFEERVGPPSIKECVFMLQKCRKERNLACAKRVHKVIYDSNLHNDRTLGRFIVAMFAECGSMQDAQHSFDRLNHRNNYSWTSLLQGYTNCGEPQRAIDLLPKLKKDPICPSSCTYRALLTACAKLKSLEGGQEVHAEIAKEGLENDSFTCSILVVVYVKCGLLRDAWEAFDELPDRDVVLWTALIAGYADHGFHEEVINCITGMRQEGVCPDRVTFICGLKGCRIIDLGRNMHIEVVKQGFEHDPIVGNTLVDMYASHGSLKESQRVFVDLPVRCEVSWTALIAGHGDHGASEDVLTFFQQMQQDRVVPDAFTFACSLKACGNVGALDRGREMHALIAKGGYQKDLFVGIALVDMYGKCGLLFEAHKVFDKHPCQENVVLWSALLAGYACSGETALVFSLFKTMVREGIRPDRVVFLSVLTSCSHAGLVEAGGICFGAINELYGISQSIEHHNCLVDLVSRAGQLHEAVALLNLIPVQPDVVMWVTLLGACRNQGNQELGKSACEYALRLHKKHSGSLLLAKQILGWR